MLLNETHFPTRLCHLGWPMLPLLFKGSCVTFLDNSIENLWKLCWWLVCLLPTKEWSLISTLSYVWEVSSISTMLEPKKVCLHGKTRENIGPHSVQEWHINHWRKVNLPRPRNAKLFNGLWALWKLPKVYLSICFHSTTFLCLDSGIQMDKWVQGIISKS